MRRVTWRCVKWRRKASSSCCSRSTCPRGRRSCRLCRLDRQPALRFIGSIYFAASGTTIAVCYLMPGRRHSSGDVLLSRCAQDGDSISTLVSLLLLYFAPGTEDCSRLRQCLVVAFDKYPGLCAAHHRLVAGAFLPAARQSMLLSAGKSTGRGGKASQLSASVIRFATQLLQTPVREAAGTNAACRHTHSHSQSQR